MKSNIDWNEIVPRLGEGLKQTLYLEAVRLMSEKRSRPTDEAQEKKRAYMREWYRRNRKRAKKSGRDYAAEYQRRLETGSQKLKTKITRRQFTPEERAAIVAHYKEHGHAATLKKYGIVSSVLNRWIKGQVKVA